MERSSRYGSYSHLALCNTVWWNGENPTHYDCVGISLKLSTKYMKYYTKMSRAHMLYDDQALQQEGVKVSKWTGAWNQKDLQR